MKTLYKDKLLNLAATMAQSLGFNNAKKGKLQSTNVQDAIDELAMRDEMISDAWVSSATYPVGGYCIYNNKLWRCLVQNSNSAPSSSNSNWSLSSVSNSLTTLNSTMSNMSTSLNSKVNKTVGVTTTTNEKINVVPTISIAQFFVVNGSSVSFGVYGEYNGGYSFGWIINQLNCSYDSGKINVPTAYSRYEFMN